MTELNTPAPPSSEQPVAPVTEPSQQGPAEASSPEPVGAEPEQEKTPEVDLEAIRKQVYEEARAKTRHEVESEFGKRLSEQRRQAEEKARQERGQLLASLSDFVPDTQLAVLRTQYTAQQQARQKDEELEQYKARLAAYEQAVQGQQLAQEATAYAQKYEYDISSLPPDVRGPSPVGFKERFDDFLAEEHRKLKKKVVTEAKKAAEDATRETERRLGVTTVASGGPIGKGQSALAELQAKHRDAVDRNDKVKMAEYGRLIEEEEYRGR